jgi:DNA modification methylase
LIRTGLMQGFGIGFVFVPLSTIALGTLAPALRTQGTGLYNLMRNIGASIALGRRGRHRTNLWTYPGASSLGSESRKGLQDHPTVKPTAMSEDALVDLTGRGDIVLDPFLGSGSTLIAAENTGRVCCGVELDPLYVDVIIRRYEAATGTTAILIDTDEPFATVAARRRNEESDAY